MTQSECVGRECAPLDQGIKIRRVLRADDFAYRAVLEHDHDGVGTPSGREFGWLRAHGYEGERESENHDRADRDSKSGAELESGPGVPQRSLPTFSIRRCYANSSGWRIRLTEAFTTAPDDWLAPPAISNRSWDRFGFGASAGGGARTPGTRIMIAPAECGGVRDIAGIRR